MCTYPKLLCTNGKLAPKFDLGGPKFALMLRVGGYRHGIWLKPNSTLIFFLLCQFSERFFLVYSDVYIIKFNLHNKPPVLTPFVSNGTQNYQKQQNRAAVNK